MRGHVQPLTDRQDVGSPRAEVPEDSSEAESTEAAGWK